MSLMALYSQLYAGAKAAKTGQPTLWHLSYNQSTNPNRRALCGKRGQVDEERIIFTAEELYKLIDPPNEGLFGGSNKLCGMCNKASPWPTIARS